MKIRIKGNSLRLRVTRSELKRLIDGGRIEDTIYFASESQARLIYALEHKSDANHVTLRSCLPEIAVVLPTGQAMVWQDTEQVGIYATIDIGSRGALEVLVEKDFACLDLSDADNLDTFPNPNSGVVC